MSNIKVLINTYNTFFEKHTLKLIIYLFIKITGGISVLILPILLGKIIDSILKENLQLICFILLSILIINLIVSIINIAENKMRINIVTSISKKMKSIVLDKILYLRINDLENTKQGEYISKIEDIDNIINMYIGIINTIFSDILGFLISIIIMFNISPILSLMCMINFMLTFFIQNIFSKNISKIEKEHRICMDTYYTLLSKVINNIKEIKKLAIESKVKELYNINLLNNINMIYKKSNVSIKSNFISSTINNIFNIVLIFTSAILIISKNMTIGNYVTFNSYITKFNYGLSKLCTLNFDIKMLNVSIERLNDLLKLDDEVKNNLNKEDLLFCNGDILIKNLKFSYQKTNTYNLLIDKLLLKHNSLNIIIGKNGCGKTTLVNLIMKFYDFEGDMFIDKTSINNISHLKLRENIMYVNQNMLIFNMSIEENLKLTNESIIQKDIEEACKKVDLHNYILTLPNQYKTILNDNNNLFSSGQLQRLSIARALLSKKRIIIFDESNSFLDNKGHKLFNNILEELSETHTVILITHKLKYISDKANIIIIDNGKVIEEGTHLQLLNYSTIYKNFISD